MELFVREYMAISFLIISISHVLNWTLWKSLFEALSKLDYAALLVAIVTVPIGLFIVLNHNVWSWNPSVMITIFGWSMTIKGLVYAIYPKAFQRVVRKNVTAASPKKEMMNRILFTLIGLMSVWILLEVYSVLPLI